jgi:hypothetical protein
VSEVKKVVVKSKEGPDPSSPLRRLPFAHKQIRKTLYSPDTGSYMSTS